VNAHGRRFTVLVCAWVVVVGGWLSPQLSSPTVERRGDHLHLTARDFHFLEGRPLEQLHDGAALPYVFTVTIQCRPFQIFWDFGSVCDANQTATVRHGIGIGLVGKNTAVGGWFLSLAFPIGLHDVGPVVMFGVRR